VHLLGQLGEQRKRQRDAGEGKQQPTPAPGQELPDRLEQARAVRKQARDVAQGSARA
jgi:hypothetical protein